MHIRNVLEEGELQADSVIKNFLTTAADGKNYRVAFYNLDMIISVGYRVKSHRGTQFRRWATERLREYIVKGFTLDDERLKQGGTKNAYFDTHFYEPATGTSWSTPGAFPRKRRNRRLIWSSRSSNGSAASWRTLRPTPSLAMELKFSPRKRNN